MGGYKHLNEVQKGQIESLRYSGFNNIMIAETLNLNPSKVSRYINKKFYVQSPERRGRKSKLSPRDIYSIVRSASNSTTSSVRITYELGLNVTSRTVRYVLKACPHLKREKKICKPPLTRRHKQHRLEWCITAKGWDDHLEEWGWIVWSDEKKFNLDGPDGLAFYWHDLRKDKLYFKKRQSGGGSVMVWAGFCAHGKTMLIFCEGTVNAEFYTDILENALLPFFHLNQHLPLKFQQDNASIHSARHTQHWINDNDIPIIEWPSKSPDLNPMENLWGYLVRQVYKDNKQYNTRDELKTAIGRAWDELPIEVMNNHINSMPRRVQAVIDARGGSTKY